MQTPYDLEIAFLGTYPSEMKNYVYTKNCNKEIVNSERVTYGMEVFVNQISEGSISKICKELFQKMGKEMNRHFSKEDIRMSNMYMKNVQHLNVNQNYNEILPYLLEWLYRKQKQLC